MKDTRLEITPLFTRRKLIGRKPETVMGTPWNCGKEWGLSTKTDNELEQTDTPAKEAYEQPIEDQVLGVTGH